jgi:hypothetical protein
VPSSTWQGPCWLCQTWHPPRRRHRCPQSRKSSQQRLEHSHSSLRISGIAKQLHSTRSLPGGIAALLRLSRIDREGAVGTCWAVAGERRRSDFTPSRHFAGGFTGVHAGVTGVHSDTRRTARIPHQKDHGCAHRSSSLLQ